MSLHCTKLTKHRCISDAERSRRGVVEQHATWRDGEQDEHSGTGVQKSISVMTNLAGLVSFMAD